MAILGGSKVSDKIKVIDALLDKADTLIIGGGMCFTFLLAEGKQVGTSLKEEDWVERASAMIEKARSRGVDLLLPVDVVVADAFSEDARTEVVSVNEIPQDMMGLDIGPGRRLLTLRLSRTRAASYRTADGRFRDEGVRGRHEGGCSRRCRGGAGGHHHRRRRFGGGGQQIDLAGKMTFISTGGGA